VPLELNRMSRGQLYLNAVEGPALLLNLIHKVIDLLLLKERVVDDHFLSFLTGLEVSGEM
jgi:hypothetical protein